MPLLARVTSWLLEIHFGPHQGLSAERGGLTFPIAGYAFALAVAMLVLRKINGIETTRLCRLASALAVFGVSLSHLAIFYLIYEELPGRVGIPTRACYWALGLSYNFGVCAVCLRLAEHHQKI